MQGLSIVVLNRESVRSTFNFVSHNVPDKAILTSRSRQTPLRTNSGPIDCVGVFHEQSKRQTKTKFQCELTTTVNWF